MSDGPDALTPTQARMMALLADGLPHARGELRLCLHDELGAVSNIEPHLTAIRKHVRPSGRDVLCVIHRRTVHYQLVLVVRPDPSPGKSTQVL